MDSIRVEVSDDNVSWYRDGNHYIYPDYSSGSFAYTPSRPFLQKYLRFWKENTSGVAETITLKTTIMKWN